MAVNWQILDLTFLNGSLRFDKTKRRLLVIEKETGEVQSYALSDVNIIFIGISVNINAGLIYHLASNDVVTIFCDWKGLPVSSMYPWIDAHGRVAARQRAQASLSVPRSKNAWMRIVKAKITGQANVLEVLHKKDSKRLKEIARSVKTGDNENREGLAAKIYWKALFEDKSFSRLPGTQNDNRNCLLDYGYTILRGHSMRAVLSAGLTPALGLHHKGRSNAFALADDLIEPFRPIVDCAVFKIIQKTNDAIINKETRTALLEACLGTFGSNEKTVPTIMTEFAQHFGQYVEGDLSLLPVPTLQFEFDTNHEN